MKNYPFFIFLIVCIIKASAQSFAPAGASWHYDFKVLTKEGYVKIYKEKDTLVAGKLCSKLIKQKIIYDFSISLLDTFNLGVEYVYEQGNTVYYFRNNKFYTLYDFNATVGSKWEIHSNSSTCSSTDSVIVDSIKTTRINSIPLKTLFVHSKNKNITFTNAIIEKIGCIGYLFPEPICVTDINEGGPLRCYSDSSNWSYQTNVSPTCDYVTAINENSYLSCTIQIYPNPISDFIYLKQDYPDL